MSIPKGVTYLLWHNSDTGITCANLVRATNCTLAFLQFCSQVFCPNVGKLFEISGSQNSVAEGSIVLGCDALSNDKDLATFRRILEPLPPLSINVQNSCAENMKSLRSSYRSSVVISQDGVT